MRVGIITITDGQNYGNRLQNFALQETLKKLGFEVDTIKRLTFRDVRGIDRMKRDIRNLIIFFRNNRDIVPFCIRKHKFNRFNRKYISFSKYSLRDNHAPDDLKEAYDFFVCGSDQIWNPLIKIAYNDIENAFALFADYEQRISYAGSFGIEEIPKPYIEQYKKLIKEMNCISVREQTGVDIVKNLTGRNAELVLDPTFLLSKQEWIIIEQKPRWLREDKYILSYFLGGRNEDIKQLMNEVSLKYKLKIINLENEFLSGNMIENINYYTVSPNEFIFLVHHCNYMFTDSFHGSVFSIIFEKVFRVFERKEVEKNNNMSTRLKSLLSMLKLEKCIGNIESLEMLQDIDFSEANTILDIKKQESINYLLKSLK